MSAPAAAIAAKVSLQVLDAQGAPVVVDGTVTEVDWDPLAWAVVVVELLLLAAAADPVVEVVGPALASVTPVATVVVVPPWLWPVATVVVVT